jgi:large subunit ribosomal protein L9
MRVIFLQDAQNVAKRNEVKDVATGFARNFLIPKGFVVLADASRLRQLSQTLEREQKAQSEKQTELASLAGKITGITLRFARKARTGGTIYGSVKEADIAQELSRKFDVSLSADHVELPEKPLKRIGEYEVKIRLGSEITARVKVSLEPE